LKALRFNQTGDFNFLQYVDFPMPILGVDEVLIEVKAARLNRNDLSNVMGRLPYTTLPRTPGRDYAGIIVDGPLGLIGHDVWGTGKENGFVRDGSHAQFIKVHQNDISIKPKTLSYFQAANCGTPYITAWFGMQSCHVQKSTKIAIIGAAGAVGSAAIELAKKKQAHIFGIVRSSEQVRILEQKGIAAAALADSTETEAQLKVLIQEHFKGGADVIYDATGKYLAAAIPALAPFGKVAVIVAPGNGEVIISARDLYRNGAMIVGVNSLLYSAQECAVILNQLAHDFDNGLMQGYENIQTHALSEAVQTYQDLSNGMSGMHVFIP